MVPKTINDDLQITIELEKQREAKLAAIAAANLQLSKEQERSAVHAAVQERPLVQFDLQERPPIQIAMEERLSAQMSVLRPERPMVQSSSQGVHLAQASDPTLADSEKLLSQVSKPLSMSGLRRTSVDASKERNTVQALATRVPENNIQTESMGPTAPSGKNVSADQPRNLPKPDVVSALEKRSSQSINEGTEVSRLVKAICSHLTSFYNDNVLESPSRTELGDYFGYYHERGGCHSIISKISNGDTPNGQVDWMQFQLTANLMAAIGNAEKWKPSDIEIVTNFWIEHGFVTVYEMKMLGQKTWASIRLPDATKATIQKYLAMTGI